MPYISTRRCASCGRTNCEGGGECEYATESLSDEQRETLRKELQSETREERRDRERREFRWREDMGIDDE